MSSFEDAREHYGPLFEVYIGESEHGAEMLYIGEIIPGGVPGTIDRRIPVKPRSGAEMVDWIESGPDELNRVVEADLPEEYEETIGLYEWYPPLPAEMSDGPEETEPAQTTLTEVVR